jgi:hypothetical protein
MKEGIGAALVALGVGGATYFAAAKGAQSITALQGKWWYTPLAVGAIGAGVAIKTKYKSSGIAILGAAGALGAFSYYVQSQSNQPAPTPPAQGMRAGDAGELVNPGEAGALMQGRGGAGAMVRAPGMRQFTNAYATRGAPSAYRQGASEAGMLVS